MDLNKIDLEIVTPDRRVFSATVEEVVLPGTEGYLGVLPGHAPLLTALAVGEIAYRSGGRAHYLAVSGGFAEVLHHSISILAETCEPAEEIDVDRAQRARAEAEAQLTLAETSESEFRLAEARLKRAIARLHVQQRGQQ